MEMPTTVIPAGADGVKQHEKRQYRCQQHHERRQPVAHDDNSKRRRPIAEPVVNDGTVGHLPGQPSGYSDQCGHASHGEYTLYPNVMAGGENDEGRKESRQDDRRNDPVAHAFSSVSASSG